MPACIWYGIYTLASSPEKYCIDQGIINEVWRDVTNTIFNGNMPLWYSLSIANIILVLAFLGFWIFPSCHVIGFDPNPRRNKKKVSNLAFAPPSATTSKKQIRSTSSMPPHAPPRMMESADTEDSLSSRPKDDSSSSPTTTAESQPIDDEPSLYLASQAPESTKAERQRFLEVREDGNEELALEQLLTYLTWRNTFKDLQSEMEQRYEHVKTDDDMDLFHWIVASQTALKANHGDASNTTNGGEDEDGWKWLPRVVKTLIVPTTGQEATDLQGYRVVQVIPALIDDNICSLKTYALAMALYIDRKLDRHSNEQATILLDLRPGEGWRNINAVRLIPFVKEIVNLLLVMFPMRLNKCILFPLPFAFLWIWKAIKTVMDGFTARQIVILSGPAGIASPIPLHQITSHVSKEVVLLCENERLASFTA